jgi:hypothetical protein
MVRGAIAAVAGDHLLGHESGGVRIRPLRAAEQPTVELQSPYSPSSFRRFKFRVSRSRFKAH